MNEPLILGIGGTLRPNSTSEGLVRLVLHAAKRRGARTEIIPGPDLVMPLYDPHELGRTPAALHLVQKIRECDGIVIASPGYHGTISGLIKNAVDYIEDLGRDERPYLSGRAVGCIGCGSGWQAAASTLAGLRSIVHALRGWPTPLGSMVNSTDAVFDGQGNCLNEQVRAQTELIAEQVLEFTEMQHALRLDGGTSCKPARAPAAG